MKQYILLLIIATGLCTPSFSVEKDDLKERIRIGNHVVEQHRDSVRVEVTLHIDGLSIESCRQLVLTPIFSDTNNKRELPPIVINGKRRDGLYRRSFKLQQANPEDFTYDIIKTKRKPHTETVQYSYQVPMEVWMKKAGLYLEKDLCGCANSEQQLETVTITDQINVLSEPKYNDAYIPSVCFITPETEPIKRRAEEGEAYVVFTVGNATLNPSLKNNITELNKIAHSLNYVKETEGTEITGITISAYASPEGGYEYNRDLAERRAQALSDYVKRHFNVGIVPVTVGGSGEDWATLRKFVDEDSYLTATEKREIIRYIDDVELPDIRESYLKKYNQGRPYTYLLNKYFPLLRRSEYRISFTVISFTIEKGKEIIKTKPNLLSLNELYHIANTYEKGSQKFSEVFDVAVHLFPKDKVANLNAGAALMLSGDYTEAAKYITPYKNDPEAWNNMGVLLMNQRKPDEAEMYLKKAAARGIKEAAENLEFLPGLRTAIHKYEEDLKYYKLYE